MSIIPQLKKKGIHWELGNKKWFGCSQVVLSISLNFLNLFQDWAGLCKGNFLIILNDTFIKLAINMLKPSIVYKHLRNLFLPHNTMLRQVVGSPLVTLVKGPMFKANSRPQPYSFLVIFIYKGCLVPRVAFPPYVT